MTQSAKANGHKNISGLVASYFHFGGDGVDGQSGVSGVDGVNPDVCATYVPLSKYLKLRAGSQQTHLAKVVGNNG